MTTNASNGKERTEVPDTSPGDERATDDHAWANDLTEENMPSPEQRENAAHDLELDPQ